MKLAVLFASLMAMIPRANASEHADVDAFGLDLSPYSFEAHGKSIASEKGEFWVMENRADPKSRRIKLSFVRFLSTNPHKGAPIVYLAGGPGGSGIAAAKGARFPIFMALREVADVIAFDQRGTGWSNDIPLCETMHGFSLDRPLTPESSAVVLNKAAKECLQFWERAGIDISGYTTHESANDLEDLRKVLGASKLKLWGISYGSHLALATLKRYPDSVERAVLAGLEGLHETVKLPAYTDNFFARVQSAIAADPEALRAYPDFTGTMRRVHSKLETTPVKATVKDKEGKDVEFVIGKFDVQLAAAWSISDPAAIARVPAMYALMDAGEFSQVATMLYQYLRSPGANHFRGMPEAMDGASGISKARAQVVRDQAKTSLLGDALNFPMPHMAEAFKSLDLGEGFRSPVRTAVPTLMFSGTLDGRTYPESAAQIAAGFTHATLVTVENGGHNIFEAVPEIPGMILAFMQGKPITTTKLTLPPPAFVH
jgi:pimeloyl-ACP methyl ester carboxylesterase